MIVDTSALIAILNNEPEAEAILTILQAEEELRISSANYVEACSVIISGRTAGTLGELENLMAGQMIEILPFTREHAIIASYAYERFGRGSGHPARLSLGDCFSYAIAKALNEQLLCKGNDFAHTDLRVVDASRNDAD